MIPVTGYDDKIIELYELGFTLEEIGARLHFSRGYVRKRLRVNEVPIRPLGYRLPKSHPEILRLYRDKGLTAAQVAETLGVTKTAVYYWLRTMGVPRRHLADRTHCANGHEFTPQNTRIDANGHRICRQCKKETARRQRQKAQS